MKKKITYGRKLQEDISSLQKKHAKLDKQEEILDRVSKKYIICVNIFFEIF